MSSDLSEEEVRALSCRAECLFANRRPATIDDSENWRRKTALPVGMAPDGTLRRADDEAARRARRRLLDEALTDHRAARARGEVA